MKSLVVLTVSLWFAASGRADEPLAGHLQKLDRKSRDALRAWSEDVRSRRDAVNKADRAAWQIIQTRADWEKFTAPRIQALRASLGEFPPALPSLAVAVTRT